MKKSEILFLYETSYNIPNGDPFTGEQRYDEETKKILVSDVRIKRFIRTYLEDIEGEHIYVSEKTGAGKTETPSSNIFLINTEKITLRFAEPMSNSNTVRYSGKWGKPLVCPKKNSMILRQNQWKLMTAIRW